MLKNIGFAIQALLEPTSFLDATYKLVFHVCADSYLLTFTEIGCLPVTLTNYSPKIGWTTIRLDKHNHTTTSPMQNINASIFSTKLK